MSYDMSEFDKFIAEKKTVKCTVCRDPRIEDINRVYQERYITQQCSIADIAGFFDMAHSTVRHHFKAGHADA